MFRTGAVVWIVAAALAGLGCAGTGANRSDTPPSGILIRPGTNAAPSPSPRLAVVPVPDETAPVPARDVPPPEPPPTALVPSPAPAPAAPAAPAPRPAPAFTNDVTAWLAAHGCTAPRPLSASVGLRYATTSAAGQLVLTIGQKEAEWNGRKLWLGFEPRVAAGRLWVHPLDIVAHLEPLLGGGRLEPAPRSITIDAGHGGRQPGSRSIAGNQFEKEFTLDWARRLGALLVARGWTVTMTRSSDMDLTLAERVDLAEAAGSSVFVSLHFNSSFPSQTAAGLETYALTPQGMASHVVRDYADDVAREYPNNRHDADNLRLAVAVHRSVLASTGATDRGVRHARFMDVLRWQNRPAILVEGGYLSNPDEARRIQSPEYRQRLAEGVAAALP